MSTVSGCALIKEFLCRINLACYPRGIRLCGRCSSMQLNPFTWMKTEPGSLRHSYEVPIPIRRAIKVLW